MQELRVGSLAPSLTGAKFIQGNLPELALGRAYVIDFWATWCPPCRATLPHLAQLQKRYPALTFAAVSTESDEQVVRRYLDANANLRSLAIAYDPQRAAFQSWMKAAGRNTIPSTFVINSEGRVAWIGHPGMLESGVSLKKLLSGVNTSTRPAAVGAMRFLNLPSRWDFSQGNLVVEVGQAPQPRSTTVRTVVKIDGREALPPTEGAPLFSVTARELLPGRHLFEAVRRDTATGREFVTDRAWVVIGQGDSGAPLPPLPQPSGLTASQLNVVRLTNEERAKTGLSPLRAHPALMEAAQSYAELMARQKHFSHTGPDGSQPRERAQRAGYPSGYCGENIALGYPDAQAAVAGWMRSQGHRENILRPQYQELGVGRSGAYWVQLFGSPR